MVNEIRGDGKAIFTIFLGLIIAVVFMANIGDQIFIQTNEATALNESVTVSAINTSLAVTGRELVTATSVLNSTFNDLIARGLALSTETVGGVRTVALTANDTATDLVGTSVDLNYVYKPDGYIDNSGGRSITALILIIAALSLVVFVIVVLLKFGSLGTLTTMFKGGRK